MNYSETHKGIEYLLVDGKLTITPQRRQAGQIQLDADDIEWLLGFLASMGVIAGRVKFVERQPGGTLVYRAALEDRRNLEDTVSFDIAVYEGEAEEVGEIGSFSIPAEDRGEG